MAKIINENIIETTEEGISSINLINASAKIKFSIYDVIRSMLGRESKDIRTITIELNENSICKIQRVVRKEG